jgi:hypothetical protein
LRHGVVFVTHAFLVWENSVGCEEQKDLALASIC